MRFDAHYPTEFIGFSLGMTCDNRINKVYIFPKYQRIKTGMVIRMLCLLRSFCVFYKIFELQSLYKLKDKLMIGPEWVSITEQSVKFDFVKGENYNETI